MSTLSCRRGWLSRVHFPMREASRRGFARRVDREAVAEAELATHPVPASRGQVLCPPTGLGLRVLPSSRMDSDISTNAPGSTGRTLPKSKAMERGRRTPRSSDEARADVNVRLPGKVDFLSLRGMRTAGPSHLPSEAMGRGWLRPTRFGDKEPLGRHDAFCTRRCCQESILGLAFLGCKPPGPAGT